MKFYIASRLENEVRVQELADLLKAWGLEHTHNWTEHGNVRGRGEDMMRVVAVKETCGTLEADLVIVLMPGEKGTHTELGMAIARGKNVIIHSENPEDFDLDATKPCSFYWLPGVQRVCCSFDKLPLFLKDWIDFRACLENAGGVCSKTEGDLVKAAGPS